MLDNKFHCKDCDNYKQCEYYNNRKGTSLICNEFRYKAVPMENIDKMIAEIEELHKFYKDCKGESDYAVSVGIMRALRIMKNYCGKENTDDVK